MKIISFFVSCCFLIMCNNSYSQNLYPLKDPDTGFYGYINKTGDWDIPPKFEGGVIFLKVLQLLKSVKNGGLLINMVNL